jgi:hypothetical protein
MEDPRTSLASLSLTHVHYDPSDPVSYVSAWLALVPQGLCIMYVTLIWATREVEIAMMFSGQMGCEALNFLLKRYIKEERPKRKLPHEYSAMRVPRVGIFGRFWALSSFLLQTLTSVLPIPPLFESPGLLLDGTLTCDFQKCSAKATACPPHTPNSSPSSRSHFPSS